MKTRAWTFGLFAVVAALGWYRLSTVPAAAPFQPAPNNATTRSAATSLDSFTTEYDRLASDLQRSRLKIEQAQTLAAQQIAMLEDIESVESRFDRGELSNEEYLQLRHELELRLVGR